MKAGTLRKYTRHKAACTNCRKIKKRCDNARPCLRCIKTKKGHSCRDLPIQHSSDSDRERSDEEDHPFASAKSSLSELCSVLTFNVHHKHGDGTSRADKCNHSEEPSKPRRIAPVPNLDHSRHYLHPSSASSTSSHLSSSAYFTPLPTTVPSDTESRQVSDYSSLLTNYTSPGSSIAALTSHLLSRSNSQPSLSPSSSSSTSSSQSSGIVGATSSSSSAYHPSIDNFAGQFDRTSSDDSSYQISTFPSSTSARQIVLAPLDEYAANNKEPIDRLPSMNNYNYLPSFDPYLPRVHYSTSANLSSTSDTSPSTMSNHHPALSPSSTSSSSLQQMNDGYPYHLGGSYSSAMQSTVPYLPPRNSSGISVYSNGENLQWQPPSSLSANNSSGFSQHTQLAPPSNSASDMHFTASNPNYSSIQSPNSSSSSMSSRFGYM